MSWLEPERPDYDAIKEHVTLSEVLARYTDAPLAQSSKYRIPCPIHKGQDDNFYVDDVEGAYFCHVCHSGGSVIDLVCALEKITHREAAAKLSEGRDIPRLSAFEKKARETEREVANWQESQLRPPSIQEELPATLPLEEGYRGLTRAAIDRFGLRRIPGEGWGQGVYIPFRDVDGTLVGYAIRHRDGLMKADGRRAPKYLNTHGDIKSKGFLYGLYENVESIRESGVVTLVEGQFDAISLWPRGVVSVMGSYMTPEQARALLPYVSRVDVMFDGDEAGQAGTARLLKEYGSLFSISITTLAGGMDPADLQNGDG